MTTARTVLLAAAVGGVLLAGCGSGSTSISLSTSTPPTNSVVRSTAASASRRAASDGGASCKSISGSEPRLSAHTKAKVEGICNRASSGAALAQYVAVCRSMVQREPTLSAQVKSKTERTCNQASDGAAARAAAKKVCVEIAEASTSPSPFRRKVLAACNGNN